MKIFVCDVNDSYVFMSIYSRNSIFGILGNQIRRKRLHCMTIIVSSVATSLFDRQASIGPVALVGVLAEEGIVHAVGTHSLLSFHGPI